MTYRKKQKHRTRCTDCGLKIRVANHIEGQYHIRRSRDKSWRKLNVYVRPS